MMPIRDVIAAAFLIFMINGCALQPEPVSTPAPLLISTTDAVVIIVVPSSPVSDPSEPFVCALNWQSLPVVPLVRDTARSLYQEGIRQGQNPSAFSKIGDGEISIEWFLASFDQGEDTYTLGDYQSLRPVIDYFHGSYARIGAAAKRGFNTSLILDVSAADPSLCNSGESPLDCELRLHKPAFAILSMGTNQVWQPEEFEKGMRRILDILVANNVLPILSTKGDNLEGDHRINRIIGCLAEEYDLPLWNFWAAIQSLPDHGLQPDLEHLTYGPKAFDDADSLQTAWTVRNLTALQVLDAVWRGVTKQP